MGWLLLCQNKTRDTTATTTTTTSIVPIRYDHGITTVVWDSQGGVAFCVSMLREEKQTRRSCESSQCSGRHDGPLDGGVWNAVQKGWRSYSVVLIVRLTIAEWATQQEDQQQWVAIGAEISRADGAVRYIGGQEDFCCEGSGGGRASEESWRPRHFDIINSLTRVDTSYAFGRERYLLNSYSTAAVCKTNPGVATRWQWKTIFS